MKDQLENITFAFDKSIGVKNTFFTDLRKEDDWSFIIKLHTLFEAVCTHLLLYHFREQKLSDVLSRLELSDSSTGKVVFLEKLGFMLKENKRFILKLSELRNDLVHNIHNCEFNLKATVQSLDSKAMRDFAVSFSPMESFHRNIKKYTKFKIKPDPKLDAQSRVEAIIERAKKDPKIHIWLGALHVLGCLFDMYDYSDFRQWEKSKQIINEDQA